MALDAIGKVFLEVGADVTALRKDIDKGLGDAERQLKRFGGKLTSVGKSMTLGLTAPIAGMGAGILKMAGDFEAGMNRVRAASSATADQFGSMRDLAKELGATTKFSASEAAEGMEILAKNGLNVQQMLGGAVDASLKLAAATGSELAGAADVATDVMLQFGKQAGELGPIVDQVTGVLLASKFGFDDYRLALGQAGSVAASSGVSIEDFNTTIAATSSMFASGSDAGTSFKTFLLRLVPQTKDAAEAMEQYGLKFFDAEGNMKSMADVAELLRRGLGGLSDEARSEVLKKIFGTDALRTAIGLMGQGAEGMDRIRESVMAASASAQAEVMTQGLSGGLIQLRSAIEGLAIAIADSGILDWATKFVSRITEVVRELGQSNPELMKWGTIVAGLAAVVGPVVLAVGLLSTAIGSIAGVIGAIGIGPILAIGSGLAVATAAFMAFKDEIVAGAQELATAVSQWWAKWTADNQGLITQLGEAWVSLKGALAELGTALMEAGQQIFGNLVVRLQETLGPIGGVEGAISKLATFAVEGLMRLVKAVTAFVNFTTSALPTVVSIVKSLHDGFLALINQLRDFGTTAVGYVKAAADGIGAAFGRITGFVTTAQEKIKGLTNSFFELYDKVVGNSYVPDMVDGLIREGQRMDQGFIRPAQQGVGALQKGFGGLRQSGALVQGLGRNLSQALQNGRLDTDSFLNTIKAHFADLAVEGLLSATKIQGGYGGMIKNLQGQFTGWFSWLTNAFSGVSSWIGNVLSGVGRAVSGVFTGGGARAATGGGGGAGLGGTIGSVVGSAFGPIGSVVGGLLGGFFAEGGKPPVRKTSIVGERGPELFIPDVPGTILPNSFLRRWEQQDRRRGGGGSRLTGGSGGGASGFGRSAGGGGGGAMGAREASARSQIAAFLGGGTSMFAGLLSHPVIQEAAFRSLKGFAAGGRPAVGQLAMVGEAGAEMFVPDRMARGARAGGSSTGGGGITVVQNFSSGVTRAELSGLAGQIKQETMAGVVDAMLRGGNFSRVMRI